MSLILISHLYLTFSTPISHFSHHHHLSININNHLKSTLHLFIPYFLLPTNHYTITHPINYSSLSSISSLIPYHYHYILPPPCHSYLLYFNFILALTSVVSFPPTSTQIQLQYPSTSLFHTHLILSSFQLLSSFYLFFFTSFHPCLYFLSLSITITPLSSKSHINPITTLTPCLNSFCLLSFSHST